MADDKVVELRPVEIGEGLELGADDILQSAIGQLSHCVVIGTGTDGRFYIASSVGAPETYMELGLAQHLLKTETLVVRGWRAE